MARGSIAERGFNLCEAIIADLGYDLVDVEYKKEGREWFLRFYIDKRGGINLDDCTLVSQTIDPIIDSELEIDQAYYLEVSSPGLERPLKTAGDFNRYMGEKVEVTLYQARDGEKRFQGCIKAYAEGVLTIETTRKDGSSLTLDFNDQERANVKRVIEF